MTQQEQFEADYRRAFPISVEAQPSLFEKDVNGEYGNIKACVAFAVWLQQAKRHEAGLAELRAKAEAGVAPVAGNDFPHEEMDVIARNRYRTEPTDSNIWGWCVRAGDGERELYKGRKSDCDAVARKLIGAFLDGAWLANEKLNAAPPAQAEAQAPSDEELLNFATSEQFLLFCDEDEFLQIAKEVLLVFGGKAAPPGSPQ